jgi:probable F420-dependent oxidoreductase
VKLDRIEVQISLAGAGDLARDIEAAGYSGLWVGETNREPFLPLALAAEHTERIELGTSVAVAFARSPMTVANAGWDLQGYSGGRFRLGLGSQIQAHIEKRFSMPWSQPAARMREFIAALHAIWDCWQDGTKLDFRGEFYQHTLMTPFFNPGPCEFGRPPVFLAAVGDLMTEVAGEMADGLFVHGFCTERYLREHILPTLDRGRARRSAPGAFEIAYPAFVVVGETEEELASADKAVRKQIAFYGSTPAYRKVLDLHGYGELQTELNLLSKRGEWDAMGNLIDDTLLDAFAVVGAPSAVAAGLQQRYGDVVDRISLYMPYAADPTQVAELTSAVTAGKV